MISRGDTPEKITATSRGDFNKIITNINMVIANLYRTIQVAEKIADGVFSVRVNILSDKDKLGKSLDKMVRTIQSINEEINDLTRSAAAGKLEQRGNTQKFKGDFALVIHGINNTLDAVIAPLKVSAEYMDRIAQGDFPDLIDVAYQGDFNAIKTSIISGKENSRRTQNEIITVDQKLTADNSHVELNVDPSRFAPATLKFKSRVTISKWKRWMIASLKHIKVGHTC